MIEMDDYIKMKMRKIAEDHSEAAEHAPSNSPKLGTYVSVTGSDTDLRSSQAVAIASVPNMKKVLGDNLSIAWWTENMIQSMSLFLRDIVFCSCVTFASALYL